MPVIQVPMEFSDAAFQGLLSGDLVRYGGVIYKKGGGVFEHLKDAKLPQVNNRVSEKMAINSSFNIDKLLNYVSKNKGKSSLIFGGVVLIGGTVFYGIKKLIDRKGKGEMIEVISDSDFNDSLLEYIKAAREQQLSLPIISKLKEQIIRISESDEDNIVVVDVKQLNILLGFIQKYTEDLARANDYEIKVVQSEDTDENNIIKLKDYISIQEDIFKRAS
ncbi:hypothetical protein [Streptococcus mutans]|uniref:hypothetical protein n=1 Tax=Streptococcus mutans TaxID=1309 RepID=UPI0002B5B633|nr:hypothetical protein [Streptococcus mutans]EMB86491.1 hypothetical protein SMU54_02775 [Streptococcus mutans A9]